VRHESIGARLGKLVNRLFRRSGNVLDGRYHSRPLRTPLEVRRALAYVLLNHRHHTNRSAPSRSTAPDPASSGRWFDGWQVATAPPDPTDRCEVASAETWLLRIGWRRHGFVDPSEVPG
jgi:hypothetical protein